MGESAWALANCFCCWDGQNFSKYYWISGTINQNNRLKCTRALQDTRLISYRLIPCWCSKCEDHDFDHCLINSEWIQKDLAKARVVDAVDDVVLDEVVVPPPAVIDIIHLPAAIDVVPAIRIGLSFIWIVTVIN